ncbi:scarecrow-like protein 9 [Phalaenopsis equestris]|uniref:scarecrow-like protein 9 n=1 Tax=Phalaenopsis equestris TaxID=78828 RepID=UPI0009E56957|nr:scarecrow-like protein 9 [Phalaenopsis equestris]
MVMDRRVHELSGVDGLSCEDFFSHQNPMDSRDFRFNYTQQSSMDGSSLHSSMFDASHICPAQNNLNEHKFGVAEPNINQSNHASHLLSGSVSVSDGNPTSSSSRSHEGDYPEDSEIFSDIVLSYISRILMEEDVDEKINLFNQETSALQATEKPFYDILGQQYPPPSLVKPFLHEDNRLESPKETSSSYGVLSGDSCSSGVVDPSWIQDSSEMNQFTFSSSSVGSVDPLDFPNPLIESQPAWQFKKGMEEAQKFLPSESKLIIDLNIKKLSLNNDLKEKSIAFDTEYRVEKEPPTSLIGSRGRKKPQNEDLDLQEGRNIKQSAKSSDDVVRSEAFDKVLLCQNMKSCQEKKTNDRHVTTQNGAYKSSHNGRKGRSKRQQKKDVVDLRTLLIHCAQAVAADDRRNANELLRQIRQYSSPFGDGTQRLAHCFADGLEARLAGTGSQIYHTLVAKRTTATDVLKAYQLYLSACPFKKISHFFSNQTILNVSDKATRVHIIDFGIYFGFQWPCLIQRLSSRTGGPPKLRITGIDVPQPGFRPTERIEETGKRLADYAKSFNVPFEYNAIASKWETIHVEDLKINKDEVLIVNCLYRFRNLVDETVVVDSPRNKVLSIIRKVNPDVFIHGIVNGAYSAPFFVTRFREALFHFSSLFDMLETTVPRDDAQRMLIERDLFGREALNVISCEGSERVERPETYKQWQVRNLRAGFTQLPLDAEIMKRAKDKVQGCYHRDFVIDQDSRWLLQGWKGRIIYAISTWKPSEKW